MLLQCRFTAAVCRQDHADYVREIEIDVLSYDEDVEDTYIVGKITLNQILWLQAIVDGESLFEVCDADSQALLDIFTILTKGETDFRKDLAIEDVTQDVLFIHRMILHPDVRSSRTGILEAALTLFGEASLAVMWMGDVDFTQAELAQLGFAKIAGTDLIYRHSSRRSQFCDENPRGLDCGLYARPEHEEWVKREWKQLIGYDPETGEV